MPAPQLGWMAESVSQTLRRFALPSTLPGEVPWPDGGVGGLQPFAQLQGGNNSSSPSPCSLQLCLCNSFRLLSLGNHVCGGWKPGATEVRRSFAADLPVYLLPLLLVCVYIEGRFKEQMFPAGDVRLLLICAMCQGWSLKFPGTLSICNWLLALRGA